MMAKFKSVKEITHLNPNIVVSVTAPPKSGKTHFACTFPAPIKIYSFDVGAREVAAKFKGKEITIEEVVLPIIDEADTGEVWAMDIWESFYSSFKRDIEEGHYATIVIDTATTMESMLRQYVLEAAQQTKEGKKKLATNEYLNRNLKMTAMFTLAQRSGANLVVTQYMKEKWVKARTARGEDTVQPTGEMILDGWAQTEGLADIALRIEKVKKGVKTVGVFTIIGSRYSRDLDFTTHDDLDYDELIALFFPDKEG